MNTKQNYKDHQSWQLSKDLTVKVFRLTSEFPDIYKFSLVSQMQRSSLSIPSNLAEGFGRSSVKEKLHFARVSLGSAYELQTQFIVVDELRIISKDEFEVLEKTIVSICRLINALIRTMNSWKKD